MDYFKGFEFAFEIVLAIIYRNGSVTAESGDGDMAADAFAGEGFCFAVESNIDTFEVIFEFDGVPFTFDGVEIGFENLFILSAFIAVHGAVEIQHQPVIFGTQPESGDLMFGVDEIDLIPVNFQRHEFKFDRITAAMGEKRGGKPDKFTFAGKVQTVRAVGKFLILGDSRIDGVGFPELVEGVRHGIDRAVIALKPGRHGVITSGIAVKFSSCGGGKNIAGDCRIKAEFDMRHPGGIDFESFRRSGIGIEEGHGGFFPAFRVGKDMGFAPPYFSIS